MSGLALQFPDELVEQIAVRVAERVAPAPEPEPWLNVDQAAEHLACGKRRIYELKERGVIRYRKDGERLLFKRADLDTYVEGQG